MDRRFLVLWNELEKAKLGFGTHKSCFATISYAEITASASQLG